MLFTLYRNFIVIRRYCSYKVGGPLLKETGKLSIFNRSYSSFSNNSFNQIFLLPKYKNEYWTSQSRNLRNSIILRNNSTVSSENVIDLTKQSVSSDQLHSLLSTGLQELPVSSLKLSSNYSPIGWCIYYLDFLHSIFPWWGAIAIATLILKICMFPIIIYSQKSISKINEFLPKQLLLNEKINEARISGDELEFARLSNESMLLNSKSGKNIFNNMILPMAQTPIFLTFFLTLKRMANHPVESLKDGGILWFTDLSIPDPFFLLPILTSFTMWLSLETSFRSGMNPNQTPLIKYGMRAIPLVTLAFIFNFPSAILMYWCTNNLIAFIQTLLLKNPSIRNFLNIPSIKVNTLDLDFHKKSFKQHFFETMENAKIARLIEERKTLDEISFKKAGIGPLPKTYKHNPTKTRNNF